MRPEEGDTAYVWDMLQHAREANSISAGRTFDDLQADDLFRRAIERLLEVIGEAANHVSTEFRRSHPEIAWRGIIGQRNVIAHQYLELDSRRIWQTVSRDIPELISLLEKLVPPEPQ